jgi:DNA invertase Pin-like site-specific DNA recombinase
MTDMNLTPNIKKDDSNNRVSDIKTRTINGIDEKLHEKIVAMVGPPIRGKLPINVQLAAKMHRAGFSYKQIGLYFGMSGCTVKRRLREAGMN